MSLESDAAKVIIRFEGFAPRAKWDVNAWRLGYGSDTKGASQTKVVRGDTTTRTEAQANLIARIPKFEQEIVRQIGLSAWNWTPVKMKPALISICYNYGSLPRNIPELLRDKKFEDIPNVVREMAHDNHGINEQRRHAEAALIEDAIR